ncbi:penicillin amidase [Labedella gwakjiensis]|uniref:Penicillin acylase family protein n=3 Tax=Actinomycetes TaxID=1760 RepID=A0A2P8H125_9MICO|nr:penicillin acylase family protein [Labedella gwakjiensis]PSL39917.1 penicillin amidase [Labedella gwakjiensis]RUQ85721.1 penicillin acylase family protein [Labedella gwakjiensis]
MRRDAYDRRRHPVRRAALVVISLLAVAAVVVGGIGLWTVQRSFPQTSGELSLAGLDADVVVTRDAAGIPQIVADSAADLFAAQGFVHAQDRFWEMDFRRHVTAGRLSELFGSSQITTDTFIRTLGWRTVAEAEVESLDDTSRSYYEAYARGVNAYLDSRSGADLSLEYAVLGLQNPGYEPEPWTPADSVAWLKAMAWDLRSNLESEIDRALLSSTLDPSLVADLYPPYPADRHATIVGGANALSTPISTNALASAPTIDTDSTADTEATTRSLSTLDAVLSGLPELLGRAGSEIGSNAWVVSGDHTESGRPLLANDPHLGPAMPSIWYQMGLRCSTVSDACPFDVAGFTFSGLPGVIIGHNDAVAWGFTNLGPDVADLYLERVTGDEYELDGEMIPLDVREETIRVAGGDDVEIRIRSTGRGPIVSDVSPDLGAIAEDLPSTTEQPEGDYALSLQWTALTPGRTPTAIFAIDASRDWDSFREAARLFEVPSQNLVYADVEGNIGYQAPGRIPIRAGGDGTTPQTGWTSSTGWTGEVPFDDLPSVYNPPSGYIVTANNAVTTPGDGPFLTTDWDAGYRADRIDTLVRGLIEEGEPITADDMADIQGDDYNAVAAVIVPRILELESSGRVADAQEILADWDFHDDADSGASALFNVFWKTLLDTTFRPSLPDDRPPAGGSRWFLVVERLLEQPDSAWWQDEADDVSGVEDALARAVTDAWAETTALLGGDSEEWAWGDLHRLDIRNASFGTSGVAPIEWLFNRGPWELSGGSSVVDAAGWDLPNGYAVDWVPSMRMVIDLDDFDRSTWINLTGASGHAFHPHYTDQTDAWASHETRTWGFTPDAVENATVDTLVLTP